MIAGKWQEIRAMFRRREQVTGEGNEGAQMGREVE